MDYKYKYIKYKNKYNKLKINMKGGDNIIINYEFIKKLKNEINDIVKNDNNSEKIEEYINELNNLKIHSSQNNNKIIYHIENLDKDTKDKIIEIYKFICIKKSKQPEYNECPHLYNENINFEFKNTTEINQNYEYYN
jgi:hypothetical protein